MFGGGGGLCWMGRGRSRRAGVDVQLCKACSEFVVNSRWFFLEKGKRRGESEGRESLQGEGVLGRCFHSRFC